MAFVLDEQSRDMREETPEEERQRLASGPAGGQTATGRAAPQQSTGYVNLQQYLKGTSPEKTGQALRQTAQEQQKEFTQQVGQAEQQAASQLPGEQKFQQEDIGQIGMEGGEQATERLREFLGRSGPEAADIRGQQAFGEARKTQSRLEKFAESLQSPQTYGMALEQVAGPRYTSGMKALDVGLIAGSPEAQQQIQGLGGELAQQRQQVMSQAEQRLQQQAAQRGQQLAQQQQALRGELSGVATGFGADVQRRIEEEQAARESARQALINQQRISQEDLEARARRQLEEEGAALRPDGSAGFITRPGLDPGLFAQATDVTYADVLTPQEQARISAIQSLLGQDLTYQGQLGADEQQAIFDQAAYQQEIDKEVARIREALRAPDQVLAKAPPPGPDPITSVIAGQGGVDPSVTAAMESFAQLSPEEQAAAQAAAGQPTVVGAPIAPAGTLQLPMQTLSPELLTQIRR